MKLNIAPADCKYIVDRSKRKVVCIIDNTAELFLDFMDSNFKIHFTPFIASNVTSKLLMPNRFIGITTCSDQDDWNEETGKLIAYSRAKDNLNKCFFKRASFYINSLDKEIERATDILNLLGQKLTINTTRRHEKITSLIGEE